MRRREIWKPIELDKWHRLRRTILRMPNGEAFRDHKLGDASRTCHSDRKFRYKDGNET